MALTNAEITAQARGMLKGAWKLPILASAVYFSIILLLNCIPVIGWLAGIAISGPLMLGYCLVYLVGPEEPDFTNLARGSAISGDHETNKRLGQKIGR